MANKTMSTYTIGGVTYDIVDKTAREDISKIQLATMIPDKTLSIDGAPADSKATGDAIAKVSEDATENIQGIIQEFTDSLVYKDDTGRYFNVDSNPHLGVLNNGTVVGVDQDGVKHSAYSDVNPPPVTKVNGSTGDVIIKSVYGGNADKLKAVVRRSAISRTPSVYITDDETGFAFDMYNETIGEGSKRNIIRVRTPVGEYYGDPEQEYETEYYRLYDDHNPPTLDVISTNTSAKEGQIITVNANSNLSVSALKIDDVVTRAMFDLENKILYINTDK